MTFTSRVPVAEGCHLGSGCGYPAPGYPESFQFNQPLFSIGSFHVYMPEIQAVLCAGLVIAFFWAAFAKPKIVPRGVQNVGELGILFVRDQILRPMMGKRGDGYMPFLVGLFFFIWFMNLMEIVPVLQFPAMAHIAFPISLMLMVYITYNFVSIKNLGLGGYFKSMVPSGVPIGILFIVAPLEVLQYIVVRPFTLHPALREHVRRAHPGGGVHDRDLVPGQRQHRAGVRRGVVRDDRRAHRVRNADPGAAGILFTILTAQYLGGAYEAAH